MRMSSTADFNVIAGLLALALAVGGAGLSYPSLQVLLGLAAVAAGAYLTLTERPWSFTGNRRLAIILLFLILALPLLQLIPLPPGVWEGMPGRELAAQNDALLGVHMWRPLTLDIERTMRSFLVILPAAAIFVGCLYLSANKLERLLWVIGAGALIGGVLGIVQFATGGSATPYQSGHTGYPVGLFVNRNHHGSFLLVGMPIVAAIGAIQLARGRLRLPIIIATLSAILLFGMVIAGTTSRMALGLLPIALIAALFILFRGRVAWRLALPSILGFVGLAVVVFLGGGLDRALARFSPVDSQRFGYWTDVQWTLGDYKVFGSGFGTFVPIYQAAESLEGLTPQVVNHAHNDFLEILLEGGFAGGALLILFFVILGLAAFKLTRSRQSVERGIMVTAAAAGIMILLVSSFVDFPLRMPALSSVLAVLCALLLPRRADMPAQARRSPWRQVANSRHRRRWAPKVGRFGALAALSVIAIIVVQAGLSSQQLLSGRPLAAAAWAPWSTEAHERASTDALLHGQADNAVEQAQAALWLSPISSAGLRSIALVDDSRGQRLTGARLMNAAAALGWRDPYVQLWAIDQAARAGEATTAVQRAEALFLQEQYLPTALILLLRAPQGGKMRLVLAAELARQPPWRRHFLAMGAHLDPTDTPAFADLIGRLGETGAGVSATEVEPFLGRLIELGQTDLARQVWRASRGDALLANGDFETIWTSHDRPLPASWSVSANRQIWPSVRQAIAGGRGNSLVISAAGKRTPIIAQLLLLGPGTYTLSYRLHAASSPNRAMFWELRCGRSGPTQAGQAAIPNGPSWSAGATDFSVPIQDCPTQRLALFVAGGNSSNEIWVDDLKLEPSRR